ncbi:RNA polymerase, sigma 54 subunit, RpoN/SigL [Clostridium frigidicarnis]|uniref:RNA polymerase, sigma 54 subunit, RpoN/SigL n=2 Tax=Clostridium frigidicarnis TaxID=84698 RepID=A0A1I0ZST5_9CLOT|nr:RNA polymerase, sigma 54 subunit, RpoN/SigL [Clostridium frigidicarnis]
MKMDFMLNLTQEQKLIMTQKMQLSIKLLQMSGIELQEYIDKELQENPVLEAKNNEENEESTIQDRIDYKELIKYFEFDNYGSQSLGNYDNDEVSPFTFISNPTSLEEYLEQQIIELNENDYLEILCKYIIENIDARGYLPMSIEEMAKEISADVKDLQKALTIIQGLEPDGIGARDLRECLKIQLEKKEMKNEKIFKMVENHLQNIADNKYQVIARDLKITPKEAQGYGDMIKTLEPKPSRGFYTGEKVKYISPDAYIKKINDDYVIVMNESITPKLSINNLYKEIINNENDKNAVDYVKNKMNGAMFLIKSVEQRKSTIYRVLEKIIEKQKDFLDNGMNYLKPMTLKEIADELEVHESTVSRAIRDKYVYIPRGTIRIKDFFTQGVTNVLEEDVSVVNIKNEIKLLIDKEDKKKPLSDQVICDELNKKDMNISRRTVAKYREEIGIKSSSKRKRL